MRDFVGFAAALVLLTGTLVLLSTRFGAVPPLGTLLEPVDGLYRTAREARLPKDGDIRIPSLEFPVDVYLDDRGVPHVYAEHLADAARVLGYLQARDRLFQLDFITRATAGRLSEVIGPQAVEADRFLRGTGMAWAARNNYLQAIEEGDLEMRLAEAFAEGVNAYIDHLPAASLPFEFRMLGYRPERFTALHIELVNQYMNYDLSYYSDEAGFSILREQIGDEIYEALFEARDPMVVPIVPPVARVEPAYDPVHELVDDEVEPPHIDPDAEEEGSHFSSLPVVPGWTPGIGSNNWAVAHERSVTGAPILAGDPHLRLSLPAIWYEAHIVTPEVNTYGVMLPGVPMPVIGFNEHLGWTFTNTGSDQIDHYRLELSPDGRRYRFDERWLDVDFQPDTIYVRGRPPVIDTVRYSHWGPVKTVDNIDVAVRWTAFERSRTLLALARMHMATDLDSFNEALRYWDVPMQNALYADVHGNIAIRSAGYAPIRSGGSGAGLLDGTSRQDEWIGRIPFEELPHAVNPEQGYLLSANQEPIVDEYPYYLGHRWPPPFRAIRIDSLLSGKEQHSVADFKRYQSDIYVVQRDLLRPRLETLTGLSERAEEIRTMLVGWDGVASVEAPEPLVFDEYLRILRRKVWAGLPGRIRPPAGRMFAILAGTEAEQPLYGDPERSALDIMRAALEATADTLEAVYSWDVRSWRWGDHHQIEFSHLLQSEALRALWRGPHEFPGFQDTVSPGGGRPTRASASWRMIVDFSESPPRGLGVYPGGQSGNPFSRWYDLQIPVYLDFGYYDLHNPRDPADLPSEAVSARLRFLP